MYKDGWFLQISVKLKIRGKPGTHRDLHLPNPPRIWNFHPPKNKGFKGIKEGKSEMHALSPKQCSKQRNKCISPTDSGYQVLRYNSTPRTEACDDFRFWLGWTILPLCSQLGQTNAQKKEKMKQKWHFQIFKWRQMRGVQEKGQG